MGCNGKTEVHNNLFHHNSALIFFRINVVDGKFNHNFWKIHNSRCLENIFNEIYVSRPLYRFNWSILMIDWLLLKFRLWMFSLMGLEFNEIFSVYNITIFHPHNKWKKLIWWRIVHKPRKLLSVVLQSQWENSRQN